jgi:hypothetical protein
LWDKGDAYDDDDDDESETLAEGKCAPLKTCIRSWFYETRHFFTTLGKYPYIIIAAFLVFALVLGTGMRAIQSEQARHIQTMKGNADFVVSAVWSLNRHRTISIFPILVLIPSFAIPIKARDTATWFSNELRRAMMPLYGIRQAVIHSRYFENLTEEIGRYPQGVIDETVGTMMTKRSESMALLLKDCSLYVSHA